MPEVYKYKLLHSCFERRPPVAFEERFYQAKSPSPAGLDRRAAFIYKEACGNTAAEKE